MTYRTTCEEHNAAGFAEATHDECEVTCPRCQEFLELGACVDEYEEEECCDDCQEELQENSAQFAWEEAQTARAEGGYGYSGGWSGHEPAWLDG